MNTFKNLFLISIIALSVSMFNCSKSSDPSPKQLTALDSVQQALTGTWNFASLTLTQIANGKSKTITSCDKSSMDNFYSDGNWINYTVEMNYTYVSNTSGSETNPCVNNVTANVIYTASQNTDGSINLTVNPGNGTTVYQVKSKDITPTSIKATMVSNGNSIAATDGYLPVLTFTRQ